VLDIVSTTDRIVPAASAAGFGTMLTLDSGHVGMVVGRRARAELWAPLARWLSAPLG
jgi:polyhydroxyalkanoate synthase